MTNEIDVKYCDRVGVCELECATKAMREQPTEVDCAICAQIQLAQAMNRLNQSLQEKVFNVDVNRV